MSDTRPTDLPVDPLMPITDAASYVRSRAAAYARVEQELTTYLRNMSDDENRAVVHRIFSGFTHPIVEREIGLAEQQKWFAKLRR
jgi:hypothetical protein